MTPPNDAAIVARHNSVWLASQPNEADLDAWAADGARIVINSRTHEETASLPFDMAAAVAARGMHYVEMPIGGSHGAGPALTRALGEILQADDGPVVMHCRSGTRSAHLYAAHLIATGQAGDDPFETMNWPGGRDPGMVRALLPPVGA
ncbi:sulfur transferase domain-containing protein [Maricaulis sp.]|uniref:beta-lactamase hydrolase domain-containing protein n=1 Tax=Maricaulis sp. TaxID=1486257 RepID=UPI0025C4661C|nr:sulfur transferase domain-containing protein [Maricaulis sp.]